MKKVIFLLCILSIAEIPAQTPLTSQQWQEDLKFLQTTIHNDYPFLFLKTTAQAFDTAVEKLHNDIPNLESHEIIVGMSKIIALFKYGHTDIGFSQKPYEFHYFPFNLYQYNEDIYIQGTHKDYPKAIGAKVLEINNIPIQDALDIIYPVVNNENSQYFKAFGINYLRIPEVLHAQKITKTLKDSIELTLEKEGSIYKQAFSVLPNDVRMPTQYSHIFQDENWLEARDQTETPLYLKHLDKIYYYEYLADKKTVYVRHSQIRDDKEEPTADFYKRVFSFIETNDVEKLIIDVRLNGGGNNFLNKSIVTGIIETKKINQEGKFFVIIGRRTFSACQNLVNELDNYTNVTFVGESTSENLNFYGDATKVSLPHSKVLVYLSHAWWQDKAPWENAQWMAPQVPVQMSFEAYSSNQDPIFDAALSYKNEDNFKSDPLAYITNLYQSGKRQELSEELPKMIKDPRYDFFDFETELSKVGFQVLEAGQAEEAISIFSFVSQLYPNSAGALKNLAESHLKAGDKVTAITLLKKTMDLDLYGIIGKEAKVLLHQIQQ